MKFFLYGQNDTFSHGQNDKNLPVLIAKHDSILFLTLKAFKHKFFHVTFKNSYFEFGVEIEKNGSSEVSICFELPFAKI